MGAPLSEEAEKQQKLREKEKEKEKKKRAAQRKKDAKQKEEEDVRTVLCVLTVYCVLCTVSLMCVDSVVPLNQFPFHPRCFVFVASPVGCECRAPTGGTAAARQATSRVCEDQCRRV